MKGSGSEGEEKTHAKENKMITQNCCINAEICRRKIIYCTSVGDFFFVCVLATSKERNQEKINPRQIRSNH